MRRSSGATAPTTTRSGTTSRSGKYSHVFSGTRRLDNASVAIKVLKPPTPFWKVRREVGVLRALGGGPSVVKLVGTVRMQLGIDVDISEDEEGRIGRRRRRSSSGSSPPQGTAAEEDEPDTVPGDDLRSRLRARGVSSDGGGGAKGRRRKQLAASVQTYPQRYRQETAPSPGPAIERNTTSPCPSDSPLLLVRSPFVGDYGQANEGAGGEVWWRGR